MSRPGGNPAQALVVSPGQITAIPVPIPAQPATIAALEALAERQQ